MKTIAILALLPLAACAGKVAVPVEVRTVVQKIPVRAACPAPDAYLALKAGRPKPLRDQPMPATADVRTAKTAAQLGRFEAPGGWADRVEAALDRCQEAEDLTAAP